VTDERASESRSSSLQRIGVILLVALGAFLIHEQGRELRAGTAAVTTSTKMVPAEAPPGPSVATLLVAADAIPIMPRAPATPPAAGVVRPHPLTPAHARIYRENRLIGALNGALDVRDAAGMRRLLASYRAEYPEDPNALFEGYAIIADCLEHPGDVSAGAARRYYARETASTLRRYVRRICWEYEP